MEAKCPHCGEGFGWFDRVKSIFTKFTIQCPHCHKYSSATKEARNSINLLLVLIPVVAGVIFMNFFVFLILYVGMLLTTPFFIKYEKV